MSWDRCILASADASDLRDRVTQLFVQQRQTFPAFAAGEAALLAVKTKELCCDGARVVVQANPRRRNSTYAKTDAASLKRRPCFLCPQNLPAEERAVAFGELVLLPNPYPILKRHCTVAIRDHLPQRLHGRIDLLLSLARALGPDMLAFYNGPRCGASAPDHFHFQACDNTMVPLLAELVDSGPRPLTSFGRRGVVFAAPHADVARQQLEMALAFLSELSGEGEEPMVNIVSVYQNETYYNILFPRACHRPTCFFAPEPARIAVTPAALEMAGILVVAEVGHLERLDREAALAIYSQVSLAEEPYRQLVTAIRGNG